MVEVNEKLYISAEDFFDSIAESVAYDIGEATGKKVRAKQIKKGYSYVKQMKNKVGRKGNVRVHITDFERPQIYRAEFTSNNGVNIMSYTIAQLEDDHIGVTYIEDFKGASKSKQMNFKLMSVFYNRRAKKRAVKLLRAIEEYAQQYKKNNNDVERSVEEQSAE